MGRRSGIGGLINAVARDFARSERASVAAQRRAIREHERQERAHARAVRQQQRSHAAYTREMEREAKRQYFEDQFESAADQTAALQSTLDELDGILIHTLTVDDHIGFDSLRLAEYHPAWQPPPEVSCPAIEPLRDAYLAHVKPPGFFASLFPSAQVRHQEQLQAAEEAFQRAHGQYRILEKQRLTAFQAAKKEYEDGRAAALLKIQQRNAEIAEFEAAYNAGEPQEIVAYNTMVLERSEYPPDLPQTFRIAHQSRSRELVVDYELPNVDVIPATADVQYVKTRDAFVEKPRKPAEVRERYQKVIAGIALRSIHEIFEADRRRHIDVITFSGFVNAVDPATGQDIRPYLISVRATREEFEKLDLRRVDPRVCVRNLGASVSARADELAPVKPIIQFDMVDPRFTEQSDILGQLDARPNIMDLTPFEFENLVGNVFTKMGLETKLTRSSRDGGVDVVAYDTRPVLGGRVVIQAKRYKNTVGVSAVRDLFGTMMNEGANKGILVTTSGYGPDAFNFAKDKPIELIDGGGLLFLCEQVGVRARIVMPAE
ncbi:MAG TPA: restriction endonuclease [Thermoanaerobaculia bacterium]|nr:restriction endonuclease [Thermoanaerobaculia bacterium]